MAFNNLVFIDNMEKNMSDVTDFMKNMTSVTPTSELDNGLTTLLLAVYTVANWDHYPYCHTAGDSNVCVSHSKVYETQLVALFDIYIIIPIHA